VHHLIAVPDHASMERLVVQLDRVGNLASDGRPILGLDSRDLLEMTLQSGPGSFLIPAHIWTPWFSMLGSQSGFDSIEACYGDLSDHIFALETGLSSDPPMNWRVGRLDGRQLVSHSDAHSPAKLGREATIYQTDLDFYAMRHALKSGTGLGGTVEFFPEEGKYHLDGHRKCQTCWTPEETRTHGGRCTVCGKPVTVGVLHRVEALADRPEGYCPEGLPGFVSLTPLAKMVAEIEQVGESSKRVTRVCDHLLRSIGPELYLLAEAPLDQIGQRGSSLLREAVERLRAGRVRRIGGYDGEFGAIRLFDDQELRRRSPK
jgi:DNA helicase-2/ATP-dependent DNA helicase PcrA